MAAYDTAALIASIKRRAMVPTSQQTFQASDFLAIADEELRSLLLPLLLSAFGEHYVRESDTTLVANQANYRIPSRAVAGKLRDVVYLDANSNRYSLPEVSPDALDELDTTSSVPPRFYYVQNQHVVLVPTPSSASGTLRLRYYCRPGDLVATAGTDYAVITSINTGSGAITCTTVPSGWSTSSSLYDLVRAKPHFDHLAIDLTATGVTTGAGGNVTVAAASLPSELAVGDQVCVANQSGVPQLPLELHALLAQLCAAKCLEALGDGEAAERAYSVASRMREDAQAVLAPRVDGEVRLAWPGAVGILGPGPSSPDGWW